MPTTATRTSAHSGRIRKPKRTRLARERTVTNRIPAMATPPTTQLQKAPIEPSRPPPRSWKLGSRGATVRPEVSSQAPPR